KTPDGPPNMGRAELIDGRVATFEEETRDRAVVRERIGDNERGYRRFRPARLLLPGRVGTALVGRPARDRGRIDDRIGGDVIAHRARSRVMTRPVPRGGFGQ